MRMAMDLSDIHDDYWTGKALLTAPPVVRELHEDYLRAGADVVTTNTFRTNVRAVASAGVRETFEELTEIAVRLAREARDNVAPGHWVAGSIGPVESCYSPGRVPDQRSLRREHGAMVRTLAAAGVDLIILETMNTAREAAIAARETARAGAPFMVSFTLGAKDGQLLSGEDLSAAVAGVAEHGPLAVLLNCCHPAVIGPALRQLPAVLSGTGILYGGQAHLALPPPGITWEYPGNCSVQEYAAYAQGWVDQGARVVGGCCGTTPAYIAALGRLRDQGLTGDAGPSERERERGS